MKSAQAYQVVGRAESRSDGDDKVTGKAIYTVDVKLPGMIHGKILRSPYAHARLTRIDASQAENLPGVFAVITRADQAGSECLAPHTRIKPSWRLIRFVMLVIPSPRWPP